MNGGLFKWLPVLVVFAIAVLAVAFVLLNAEHTQDLGLEVGKGAVQLLVVVLFGGVVKLLADRYQDGQRRADLNREFRQDKYNRLVEATNALRKISIRVHADPSVETRNEQMIELIDAGLKLRMIKHQIYSSRELADPPFPNYLKLAYLFEVMYHYTDQVIADFAGHDQALSELPPVSDPRDEANETDEWREQRSAEREAIGAALELDLTKIQETGQRVSLPVSPPEGTTWSWVHYEEAEDRALEMITRVSLERDALRRRAAPRRRAVQDASSR
jgi:hypothetical protein